MTQWRWALRAGALAAMVTCTFGCGDDDGIVGDGGLAPDATTMDGGIDAMPLPALWDGLAGRWRLDGLERVDGAAFAREDDTLAGEVVLSPTGESEGTMTLWVAMLEGGLLGEQGVERESFDVVLDGSTLVIDVGDHREAYTWSRLGDRLDLVRDPMHPMDGEGSDGLASIRLSPVNAPTIVGDWQAVSFGAGEETFATGECIDTGSGPVVLSLEMDFAGDRTLSIRMQERRFSDPGCTMEGASEEDLVVGFLEESPSTLSVWAQAESDPVASSQRLDFSLEREGDTLQLRRTGCEPADSCSGEGPTAIVLIPR